MTRKRIGKFLLGLLIGAGLLFWLGLAIIGFSLPPVR
jgi:hypothetical protein